MLSPVVEESSVQPPDRASVTEPDTPMTIREGVDDWRIVRVQRPNALIVGRPAPVEAMLARELRSVGASQLTWSDADELVLTDVSPTAVIRDVHQLSSLQQERLLGWLAQNPAVQVVATATSPIYPLVVTGQFLEGLYYRLNVFSFFLEA